MSEKETKCPNCVKFKTQYCPCTIDCMATDDYPYYQDRRMMLEENTNLKQALIDIREYVCGESLIKILVSSKINERGETHYDLIRNDILEIIDKYDGGSNE